MQRNYNENTMYFNRFLMKTQRKYNCTTTIYSQTAKNLTWFNIFLVQVVLHVRCIMMWRDVEGCGDVVVLYVLCLQNVKGCRGMRRDCEGMSPRTLNIARHRTLDICQHLSTSLQHCYYCCCCCCCCVQAAALSKLRCTRSTRSQSRVRGARQRLLCTRIRWEHKQNNTHLIRHTQKRRSIFGSTIPRLSLQT